MNVYRTILCTRQCKVYGLADAFLPSFLVEVCKRSECLPIPTRYSELPQSFFRIRVLAEAVY